MANTLILSLLMMNIGRVFAKAHSSAFEGRRKRAARGKATCCDRQENSIAFVQCIGITTKKMLYVRYGFVIRVRFEWLSFCVFLFEWSA